MSAPVIPAHHDRGPLRQPRLDILHPDVRLLQRGGIGKAAHAVKDIQGLLQCGARIALQLGTVQRVAQRRQSLLVPVVQPVIPVQHHQRRGHAAGPLAGLLHGAEMGQDREGVGGLQMVDVRMCKVGGVRMVSRPLHRVRSIVGRQVDGIRDLHLVGEILGALLRVRIRKGWFCRPGRRCPSCGGAAGQHGQQRGSGNRQSDCFFHFSISFCTDSRPFAG